MQKETGEDSAGPGADKREDDPNEGQETDKTHGPTQLGCVKETEKHAGQKNAGSHASAKRRGRFHAKEMGDRGNNSSQDRIQVTAKKCFFHQRRNEDGHGHEQHGAVAILEELLDGSVVRIFHARAGDSDEDRQSTTREKIHPGAAFSSGGIRAELFPAERTPEGGVAEHGDGHIQKKKHERGPEDRRAHKELGIRLEKFPKLILRQMPIHRIVSESRDANGELTDEPKHQKDQEVRPGPGDAQVFGQNWSRSVCGGWTERCVRNGIASEQGSKRLRGRRFEWPFSGRMRFGILIVWLERMVVEESHRFPGRDFFGQPAANAAATSGKSSSWWPVMA